MKQILAIAPLACRDEALEEFAAAATLCLWLIILRIPEHTEVESQQSSERVAVQVLFSRYVGELRQGRWVDTETFGWPERSEPVRRLLLNALSVQSDYLGNATMLQNRLNLGG